MKDMNESKEVKDEVKETTPQTSAGNAVAAQSDTNKKEKEKISKKVNASFHGRKFRSGAYTTAISVVVIAILMILNIFVTKINPQVDFSSESMFTLTKDTKSYVKSVKDEIKIYYLVETGNEQKKMSTVVDKYDDICKNVSVEYIDPILHPSFATQYTDEKILDNSVIVVNETKDKSKYLSYSSMLQSEMDYTTYQPYVTGIDVEGQVTAAIQYVTTDNLPVMYVVDGHGESQIGPNFTSLLQKQNVEVKTLKTITEKSIPEDCKMLFFSVPKTDYTEEEVTMFENYIARGGNAIIVGDYSTNALANFNAFVNYYGVEIVKGVVLEGDQNNMYQSPMNVLPNILENSITTNLPKDSNTFIVTRNVSGIRQLETKRSKLTFESLLNTSDKARTGDSQSLSKEDSDIAGPFDVAVAITDKYQDKESKIIILGSKDFVNDSAIGNTSFVNYQFMAGLVNCTADVQVEPLNIPVRAYNNDRLATTTGQFVMHFILSFIVLPLVILAIGIVVVLIRRKK